MWSPLDLRLASITIRPRLPRRTARLRLALLYGCVFIACGAALLAINYALVVADGSTSSRLPSTVGGPFVAGNFSSRLRVSQHAADLHTLVIMSVLALAIMAVISVLLGWLIPGRVLSPVQTLTTAARGISATRLHQRLALDGPDDELKELADAFDAMLERLDASFKSQQRFVANASHELRTPLARLKTLTQVALADPAATPASLRSAHEQVLASERQLEGLIDALLTLASSEQAIDRDERCELESLVESVLRSTEFDTENRRLHIQTHLSPAPVTGDPQLLERLIRNLTDNAIRHNIPNGHVEVTTELRDRHAVLIVTNTGPFVPAGEVERLLRPFQRAGADRTGEGLGLGLGLSIVHAIATAHDAKLTLNPQPDGGLRAEVSFPEVSASGGGRNV